jgi:hypothetical protein
MAANGLGECDQLSAINVDVDGKSIWAGDRCGANTCAGSDVDPIVKLDPDGKVAQSFGKGLLLRPHGMFVDKSGNVRVADGGSASPEELKRFPNAAGEGHTVIKFSPQGKVLMTIGATWYGWQSAGKTQRAERRGNRSRRKHFHRGRLRSSVSRQGRS